MSETTTSARKPTYKPGDKLTRQQAADYLGISLSRLSQHRRSGLIDHVKNPVSRAVHYRFRDVERLRAYRETGRVPS